MDIPSLSEFVDELVGRSAGPFKLRLLLQPLMSAFFAIRSARRGARAARTEATPSFPALLTDASRRRELLRETWRDVGRVFVLAVVLDLVYQIAVLRAFRPLEAAVMGVALAIVPYLLFREFVNRFLRTRRPPRGAI